MSIGKKIGDIAGEVYEKMLIDDIKRYQVPHHVGIITDGNRRYARSLGLSDNEGHVKGKEKLEEVLEWCMEVGVKIVTVYGFSTENFKRNNSEVDFLFHLINEALRDLMKDERIKKNGIRVKVIGETGKLPGYLKETIREVEQLTEGFKNFKFNLAIGYGGREEIINAIKSLVRDVQSGMEDLDSIDEKKFREYLYDGSIPDPDLILRTSGEERISNFLLWQSAYSELYFSDVNWPELKKVDFLRAISAYQSRKRRFGA
ncbi:polyprenyl diphosphate synthase [Oxyplasma meridianum]|uniref:Tritrans,polycis-undecaprenyl-diphosphate synthase (geranylgeranyl-diphosphate specific) n=1 Tax=Oxyplasma meridianum TaxID=3073602 RepID=A0AAX4NEJ1_9ARCH